MQLTAIILTKNEELHIERCINSLKGVANKIIIVDSGSTDSTMDLAKKMNVKVFYHEWQGHGAQFNWAMQQLDSDTDWILRIDADEYLSDELINELNDKLPRLKSNINGIYLKRKIIFQNKMMRYGGLGRIYILRIIRPGFGKSSTRLQDEHLFVKGKKKKFNHSIIDENLNNITWWTQKHNLYSSNEATEMLKLDHQLVPNDEDELTFKGFIKNKVYSKMPTGLRGVLYFILRYFILFGFLDGKQGFNFHFLQALWYRVLVDIKINELRAKNHYLNEIYKKPIQKND